jgi:16S rRNA (uracil1498-N3)-methyltransferase
MSIAFFYVSPDAWGPQISLAGQEVRHMKQVLRLSAGDRVGLLDGRGHKGIFSILAISRKEAQLALNSETYTHPPKARAIMALAFSKAVRRSFFFEKAVELGAHAIWLWQGDHSQGQLAPSNKAAWQRQLVAGAKQSKNPWLPELCTLTGGVTELIARSSMADHKILPWEYQEAVPMFTPDMAGREGLSIYVIGPEGGFSERELAALRAADFCTVSLGARVLRCETAAMLCLGLHWWSSQLPGKPDAGEASA